ncbi:hypothetical protein [Burkholderia cepacia]|uniref:hypothetical protein n=1 Tax=Burkholderia cepacia TaxID=292 RepID=UPI00075B3E21|nr:hypothetical protein [Burkholderia cepacia]KWH50751.1 hypothetical protein WM00_20835 [Burkholderia cepacia]
MNIEAALAHLDRYGECTFISSDGRETVVDVRPGSFAGLYIQAQNLTQYDLDDLSRLSVRAKSLISNPECRYRRPFALK